MTYTIFTVTAEQIAALDAARAVELIAELLWAEARRLGFPTTHVQVSTRITVPDGGIDTSVDPDGIDMDKWVDSFIPEKRTSLQIKTGGLVQALAERRYQRRTVREKEGPVQRQSR